MGYGWARILCAIKDHDHVRVDFDGSVRDGRILPNACDRLYFVDDDATFPAVIPFIALDGDPSPMCEAIRSITPLD